MSLEYSRFEEEIRSIVFHRDEIPIDVGFVFVSQSSRRVSSFASGDLSSNGENDSSSNRFFFVVTG